MKISITLALLCLITTLCSAQSAILKMKDGNEYSVVIKATSSTSIFFEKTSVPYSEVTEVIFEIKEQKYQSIYERLIKNGITIIFSSTMETIIPDDGPTPEMKPGIPLHSVTAETSYTETITFQEVINSIDTYQELSNGAKGVQLLGAALLSTYFVLNAVYTENNKNAKSPNYLKTVPMALPIAGAVIFTIGISIDMSALRHLKIKH